VTGCGLELAVPWGLSCLCPCCVEEKGFSLRQSFPRPDFPGLAPWQCPRAGFTEAVLAAVVFGPG